MGGVKKRGASGQNGPKAVLRAIVLRLPYARAGN